MKVVDANVLLYAVNSEAPRHAEANRWLDGALSGSETVGFAWIVLLAFVRLSTKSSIFPSPLSADAAFDRVDAWLAQPQAVVIEPSPRHGTIVRGLLASAGAAGNLVTDAHLAALALEHRGEVVTYDTDFGRFDGVRWSQPG